MWANLSSTDNKSPFDILKEFQKSLGEETDNEFTADMDIGMRENANGFPLPWYRFYINHEDYTHLFMSIEQTYCDMNNGISYYPVRLTFHFFDTVEDTINDNDQLEEKITEVVGSEKTGNFLEYIRRISDNIQIN